MSASETVQRERRTCALCEARTTSSSRFLPIVDGRIGSGGYPVVLPRHHEDSEHVCLEHWLKNRDKYMVCPIRRGRRPSRAAVAA